ESDSDDCSSVDSEDDKPNREVVVEVLFRISKVVFELVTQPPIVKIVVRLIGRALVDDESNSTTMTVLSSVVKRTEEFKLETQVKFVNSRILRACVIAAETKQSGERLADNTVVTVATSKSQKKGFVSLDATTLELNTLTSGKNKFFAVSSTGVLTITACIGDPRHPVSLESPGGNSDYWSEQIEEACSQAQNNNNDNDNDNSNDGNVNEDLLGVCTLSSTKSSMKSANSRQAPVEFRVRLGELHEYDDLQNPFFQAFPKTHLGLILEVAKKNKVSLPASISDLSGLSEWFEKVNLAAPTLEMSLIERGKFPPQSPKAGPPPGEQTNNNKNTSSSKSISNLADSMNVLFKQQQQQHPPQISHSLVKVTGVQNFEFTTVEAQPGDTIGNLVKRAMEADNHDGQNAFIGKIWDEERETRYVTCANDNDAVIRKTIESCRNIVWAPGFFNSITL
ncbi:hypothetical protein ScalyP_jg6608, partial [Parmales sp. scaly parma]